MNYKSSAPASSKGKLLREFHDKYIVIDLETTGLSSTMNEIIEFCGIKIENGQIIDELTILIKPSYPVDAFITSLTGISNEMLIDESDIESVIDEITDFLGDSILLGHNTNFDVRFLYDNLLNLRNTFFENNYMDLLSIVRKLYPSWRNHKLDTTAFKLNTINKPAHRAKSDCMITYEAYELCKNYIRENNIDYKSLFRYRRY